MALFSLRACVVNLISVHPGFSWAAEACRDEPKNSTTSPRATDDAAPPLATNPERLSKRRRPVRLTQTPKTDPPPLAKAPPQRKQRARSPQREAVRRATNRRCVGLLSGLYHLYRFGFGLLTLPISNIC